MLGMATASLAGSPAGVLEISPSIPLQGMETAAPGPGTDIHAPSYALTGQPVAESGGWQWVTQSYGGRSNRVIPVR
jgi:hypothetical protein